MYENFFKNIKKQIQASFNLYSKENFIEFHIILDSNDQCLFSDKKWISQRWMCTEGIQCRVYTKRGAGVSYRTLDVDIEFENLIEEAMIIADQELLDDICEIFWDDYLSEINISDSREYSHFKKGLNEQIWLINSHLPTNKSIDKINIEFCKKYRIEIYANNRGVFFIHDKPCNLFMSKMISEKNDISYFIRKAYNTTAMIDEKEIDKFFNIGVYLINEIKDARILCECPEYDYLAVEYSLMGMIVHEALGHALEGDNIYNGSSKLTELKEKNNRIVHKNLNIICDSTIDNCGKQIIDSHGIKGGPKYLVKNGVLIGAMTDKILSKYISSDANGHARNQYYYERPQCRMTSIYLAPNDYDEKVDLNIYDVESVKKVLGLKGYLRNNKKILYLFDWIGGNASWSSLNFRISIPLAYLISAAGDIQRFRNIVITGNALDLLNSYEKSFGKLRVDTFGYCSKQKTLILTSDGGPELTLFKKPDTIKFF
ncbi:Predicted Zn-dependent protease or its inactivated homolog [Paramaledivibacter caminithermalis DSM 15212]|uniref:Predicted Zn-dependent protease or its inactivated homolog n=2 Tax=Paramaledivibacter TaxID=1884934 RepID=A0A1M6MWJ1_PARC5|nr:Predicted Zn-dependent protease or its inactivated homolog [Paramaledivibacter caminithermalis DSM 15212]